MKQIKVEIYSIPRAQGLKVQPDPAFSRVLVFYPCYFVQEQNMEFLRANLVDGNLEILNSDEYFEHEVCVVNYDTVIPSWISVEAGNVLLCVKK
jgi:hypothetical protein